MIKDVQHSVAPLSCCLFKTSLLSVCAPLSSSVCVPLIKTTLCVLLCLMFSSVSYCPRNIQPVYCPRAHYAVCSSVSLSYHVIIISYHTMYKLVCTAWLDCWILCVREKSIKVCFLYVPRIIKNIRGHLPDLIRKDEKCFPFLVCHTVTSAF